MLAALVLVAPMAVGGPVLRQVERAMILFPGAPSADHPPADTGIEEVRFPTADGSTLHGWFVPGEGDCAVLMSHGNAGDVASRGPQLLRVARLSGCPTLLYDYRGYGKSEGSPSLRGVEQDGRAAAAFLADRTGVPRDQLILHGRSLGGGVSCAVADRDGARALILVNTFSSLKDMTALRVPIPGLGHLLSEPLDSAAAMRRYRGPVLQTHGTVDEVIPFHIGERLHHAIGRDQRFVVHEGYTHNQTLPTSWDDEVRAFLAALP